MYESSVKSERTADLRCICSCLDCRFLIRANMSRCPAEYCSMTSITSYGRRLSLNLRLDTMNLMMLRDREFTHIITVKDLHTHREKGESQRACPRSYFTPKIKRKNEGNVFWFPIFRTQCYFSITVVFTSFHFYILCFCVNVS